MPDKDNENKFMAMLERMGMVRKIDSDDEDDPVPSATVSRRAPASPSAEEDIFNKFSAKESDNPPGAPFSSSHQPVPGMPEPVLPEVKPQAEAFSEPEDFFDDQYQRKPAGKARAQRFDQSFWDEPTEDKSLPIEAYTDRFLDIDELYNVFSMKTSGTETIYLIEEYLKSLPASLPDESRRDIISKILTASGFSYDSLMSDGVTRVGKLKEYAEKFAQRTDEYVASRNIELESLEQQIQKVRNMIERRKELHKKQFFSIEAEAQRLKDILGFLSD